MQKLSLFWASLRQSLRIMSRNKVGFAGLIMTLLIVAIAYIAPLLLPAAQPTDMNAILEGPSAAHWLGTDNLGHDVLKLVLTGGKGVITVAFLTAFCTVFLGTFLGALGAVLGGWVNSVINAFAELIMTIPHFPLLLVIAAFIRLQTGAGLALIIAAISWGGLMRTVRSQVLSLKERDYVQAARALGMPTSHLLFSEILPNMMSYILVSFIMNMTNAIYYMTTLVFLGITPISNNWSVMFLMANKYGAIYGDSRMFLFAPVVAIVLLQFSLITMSRSLDELFNPRLRVGE